MANAFQQKAQVRKMIYAALILGLFTVTLIHRKLPKIGLDAQAFDLQLREASRGEVSLTSSAVRQVLIGSRAITVSLLWHAAIEAQDKQNWSEVQLLVDSITMLQPYFIAPWRFQGWNLAFNVSVQCDRPADKYYYIAHGLSLLAEGERRNQGAVEVTGKTRFPGNPDLRRDIGFFYHMKMGISDDKYTMRSLLDLSCIDPVERDFESLSDPEQRRDKLRTFCRDNPMLVRRLIEHVGCDDSLRIGYKILKFLKDNKDVPSRFEPVKTAGQKKSILKKEASEQFPILPHPEADWPNPNKLELTSHLEPVNVYVMSRTWYQYAQKPLPPDRNFFDMSKPEFPKDLDPTQYRMPSLDQSLFRCDPGRAEEFLADSLEAEGWFDGEGWNVTKFLSLEENDAGNTNGPAKGIVIGTEPKYQVKRAWVQAHTLYKNAGLLCGLYFDDALERKFEGQAEKYRSKHGLRKDEIALPLRNQDDEEERTNRFAHEALRIRYSNNGITNYNGHLYTCEAKGTDAAVLASKYFYNADQLRKTASRVRAIEQYELAQPIWLDVLLRNPRYAGNTTAQEDTFHDQLMYCSLVQGVKYKTFQDVLIGVSELAPTWGCIPLPWSSIPGLDPKRAEVSVALLELAPSWPFVPVPYSSFLSEGDRHRLFAAQPAWSLRVKSKDGEYVPLLSEADRLKIMSWDSKIRTTRGFFDMMQYYKGPEHAAQNYVPQLKDALVCVTYGTSLSPRVPFPYEPALMLTRAPLVQQPPPKDWRDLIERNAISVIRARLQIPQPKY